MFVDVRAGRARHLRPILRALGQDIHDETLADTPRRVADLYQELLTPQPFRPTTFPNDEGYDELVLVRDIPFHSLCQHHLLPFSGVAHVGYLPAARILGLSKLARVVDLFARGTIEGAVLAMGVYLSGSTKIVDRATDVHVALARFHRDRFDSGAALEDPELYTTAAGVTRAQALGAELDEARVALDEAIVRWERAVEVAEAAGPAA